MIKIKRAYDKVTSDDGERILIDGLWPRGVSKEDAHLAVWFRNIAPTPSLRKWFSHDPKKWEEFKKRYTVELKKNDSVVDELVKRIKGKNVTLLYAAKDTQHNNAIVVKEYLEKLLAEAEKSEE